MSDHYLDLNAVELDVLREVSNIGAGNAATALAEILSDRLSMTVPLLRILPIGELASILGGHETEVVGILLTFSGDLDGMLMYILERRFADSMLQMLLHRPTDIHSHVDELDLSALREIGNIVAGAYVNALADLTDLSVSLSPPELAIDMVGAILSYPASIFGILGDKVLFVREDFGRDTEQVSCHLVILPDPQSLDLIMKRLGVTHE